MKKIILTIIIIFITGFFFFIINIQKETKKNTTQSKQKIENNNIVADQLIVLFYSKSCPHCRRVEAFIDNNNIKQKISFIKKEISENETNKNDLIKKAKQCNLPLNKIGVPFLWDGKKCIIGDEDIINFFEQKNNG